MEVTLKFQVYFSGSVLSPRFGNTFLSCPTSPSTFFDSHLLSLGKRFWSGDRAAVFHFLVMICLFNYRKNSLDLIVEERIKPYHFFKKT